MLLVLAFLESALRSAAALAELTRYTRCARRAKKYATGPQEGPVASITTSSCSDGSVKESEDCSISVRLAWVDTQLLRQTVLESRPNTATVCLEVIPK